jgi:hypothetical protein
VGAVLVKEDAMRIPEVRERLLVLADELEAPGLVPMSNHEVAVQIKLLVLELFRRAYKRKAPDQSLPMTPALRLALRNDAMLHPDDTYQTIAERHGVSAGRVSEAVAGKRR